MKKKVFSFMLFAVLVLQIAVLPASAAYVVKNPAFSSWTGETRYNDVEVSEGWVEAKIVTDPDVVYDGLASAYLYMGGNKSSTWAKINQVLPNIETGKTYRLSAAVNSSNCHSAHTFRFGSENSGNIFGLSEIEAAGKIKKGEWCEFTYDFVYRQASNVFSITNWHSGTLYIDNVSIKQVIFDEEGNEIGLGEELILNGDFESDLDFTPCSEVTDIEVTNMDTKAEVIWKNPKEQDFKAVEVYKKNADSEEFVLSTAEEKAVVTGLANNVTQLIVLKTRDEWDNLSEGVTVEVTPIADSFKATEPVFKIDGSEAASIAAGELSAEMSFKNNRYPADYSAELILALYKDGALVDITSGYTIIPVESEEAEYTTITTALSIPEGEGYTATLYVWDSLGSMKILYGPYELD